MLRMNGKTVGGLNEGKQNTVRRVESSESFAQPHGGIPLSPWLPFLLDSGVILETSPCV
jgi:hypothetical protein